MIVYVGNDAIGCIFSKEIQFICSYLLAGITNEFRKNSQHQPLSCSQCIWILVGFVLGGRFPARGWSRRQPSEATVAVGFELIMIDPCSEAGAEGVWVEAEDDGASARFLLAGSRFSCLGGWGLIITRKCVPTCIWLGCKLYGVEKLFSRTCLYRYHTYYCSSVLYTFFTPPFSPQLVFDVE